MRRMRKSRLRAITTAGAVGLALALPVSGASALTSAPEAVESKAFLLLTIVPDEPSNANPVTAVTLECGPIGGTHPDPMDACRKLEAVNGDFEALPSSGPCLQYVDPVTITASGHWRERSVSFEDRHINRGCAAAGTNQVFAF